MWMTRLPRLSDSDPPASRCPSGMPSACRWRTGEALRAGGGQAQIGWH